MTAFFVNSFAQDTDPAERHTFTYDGLEREFWLYVPDSPTKDMPLVFVLHGYGGKAEGYRREMTEVAKEEGFAVCYPQGRKNSVGKTGWNVGYPTQQDLKDDDVALVTYLAHNLQQEYGFSTKNTFLSGMSNGGEMCYILAWSADTTFSALASVAGLTMRWLYDGPKGTRPIPFMEIHGTGDKTSHWDGDPDGKCGWGAYVSVPSAVSAIVAQNKCAGYEKTELPLLNPDSRKITLHRYFAGENNYEVRLYEVENGPHSWAMKDMDTCREIWNFFKLYLR
ncbi:MAG: esterase [Bacteroidales bacterium]|nr:esterase [Bacteroidales bacterium]